MNICFFLKPKATVVCLYDYYTLRQTLEIMENSGYSTLPIINIDGKYIGTISEGDILSYFKSLKVFNLKDAEKVPLTLIERKRNYSSIRINSKMSDLLNLSKKENFIPVVDDRDMFIGIITRQDIIDYFYKNNLGDIYE